MVGAGFLGHHFGAVHGGHVAGGGVEGDCHFGGVEGREGVAIVDVVFDAGLCEG